MEVGLTSKGGVWRGLLWGCGNHQGGCWVVSLLRMWKCCVSMEDVGEMKIVLMRGRGGDMYGAIGFIIRGGEGVFWYF